MPAIVLATINARYVHAAMGLRYLMANLGELQASAEIVEFVAGVRPLEVVERLLAARPRIIGLSVYIWNVEELTRVAALLKQVAPEIALVVGGPEVSYEIDDQRLCQLADYVVTGWGDVTFAKLCNALLHGEAPRERIIAGEQPPLDAIRLPYRHYTDEDVRQRFVYVEASRGCPFKCEFCLSSLDKTAWPFELETLLGELSELHARGARHFRFVDRTFNLKVATSVRILEFFLECMDEKLFVHFEVIPDHLPEKLKATIARFPAGALQFEVGIQTWNPEVQALISRRQDNGATAENLLWLRERSQALIHADLIAGLPGEDLASFAQGFDKLYALRPHEIQVGILKRLRGTPIARHTQAFRMRYNPDPPYNILATDRIGFTDMQRINRFARYWEMTANSGRFKRTLPLLLGNAPFTHFMLFSDWLYATSQRTHAIALERLFELCHDFLTRQLGLDPAEARETLLADYAASGARGKLAFATASAVTPPTPSSMQRATNRQARHT